MIQWLKWLCIGLLATGCAVALTACDDDDDDNGGGTTTIVVTNVVDGTTTVVTNAPAPQALVAPQLVTPEDDRSYNAFGGEEIEVDFEWTAVPGAASYVLEVNGTQQAVADTTHTLSLDADTYQWRVWGKDANGASGPPSQPFTVTIVDAIGPPAP